MGDISESNLPGIGVRYDMTTRTGRAIGVVVHRSGRRDLVVYAIDDPDAVAESVELSESESLALGELFGGSRIVERLDELTHRIEDLTIAWVRIDKASSVAGLTLAEIPFRDNTGASVVALVGQHAAVPAPGGDEVLAVGDTAVIVGLPAAVDAATRLLDPETKT